MTAPDRPGDRDQQQAAEVAWLLPSGTDQAGWETTVDAIAALLADARVEEAARWRAKIEAHLRQRAVFATQRGEDYAAVALYNAADWVGEQR